MKTICYLVLLTAGLWGMPSWVLAQQTPATPNFITLPTMGPKIKFEKLIWDFGKVTGGETVKAEFVFTNTGDTILEITDVHPGCGCTTAGEWTRNVEPGLTGIIPLKLNTTSFNGQIDKTALVSCNDPQNKQVVLHLKADVWRPIQVAPLTAMLQINSETPSNAATVKIISNLDTPLTLSDVQSFNPAFGAELKTVKEGKEYELEIRTLPPFVTKIASGQITVKTSATNMPVISVTAFANYQPLMTVLPGQISLPQAPLASPTTMSVMIRNNSSNAVEVTSTSVNVKGTEVKLTPFNQNKYINVAVTFPAGTSLKPADNAELIIKTTHPSYPEMKVPILQLQPGDSVSAEAVH